MATCAAPSDRTRWSNPAHEHARGRAELPAVMAPVQTLRFGLAPARLGRRCCAHCHHIGHASATSLAKELTCHASTVGRVPGPFVHHSCVPLSAKSWKFAGC